MKHFTKEFTKNITVSFLAGATVLACLSGCGTAGAQINNSKETAQEETGENSEEVKVVKFGSGTINADYCFIGEDGELAGFEYDIARNFGI